MAVSPAKPEAAQDSNQYCRIPAGTPVLVTGATGFTGSLLARKLAAAGLDVRAVARPSSDIEPLADQPIKWFRGNVYDEETITPAAAGAEYIFHVAAAFRQAKIANEEYALVHVKSTKLLAQAALSNPNFKRFVHVSTMGVHGHVENPPGNEESPFAPGDMYQVTKAEAELWLRRFAGDKGLPLTVIRPTGIYGPGDRRLFKIFKMAALPVFPILGRGKCLYHLIHVEDLTDAMCLAATHPAALGEVFLVGNSASVRLEDVARLAAQVYGRKLRIARIPVGPFFMLADICEGICRPLGIEPPLYRRRVAFYTKDRSFDTHKLRERLGFQTRYTNEAGIVQTARWYVDNGWIKL
jgi:dihydroflavonol-4-reductase